jgi:hypothetical protein
MAITSNIHYWDNNQSDFHCWMKMESHLHHLMAPKTYSRSNGDQNCPKSWWPILVSCHKNWHKISKMINDIINEWYFMDGVNFWMNFISSYIESYPLGGHYIYIFYKILKIKSSFLVCYKVMIYIKLYFDSEL